MIVIVIIDMHSSVAISLSCMLYQVYNVNHTYMVLHQRRYYTLYKHAPRPFYINYHSVSHFMCKLQFKQCKHTVWPCTSASLDSLLRGLVQTIPGKINVILTLKISPPSLPLLNVTCHEVRKVASNAFAM